MAEQPAGGTTPPITDPDAFEALMRKNAADMLAIFRQGRDRQREANRALLEQLKKKGPA